jgi:prepilin-type N-terminal cleavage/methylation domain-containing protein
MRRRPTAGFTLIELLVSMGLLAIVFIGVLNMLDTSTQLSKVEAALADTQENVRFAAYHIMRTARMAGGGEMPFARGTTWIVARIDNNQSGSVTIPGFGSVQSIQGSDVLTLRGFFETAPFFTRRFDINSPNVGIVTIRERRVLGDASSDFINDLSTAPSTNNALNGRGIVFMGRRLYRVGEITGSERKNADPSRVLELSYGTGSTFWQSLNPDLDGDGNADPLPAGGPGFDTYRVGILQSYTYYVRSDFTLMRRRAATTGWVDEPVAVNVGSLQVLVGLDTDNDGEADTFNPNPGTADVINNGPTEMRITILGRTPFAVRDWTEPIETFNIAGDSPTFPSHFRNSKWRRMDVTAGLRNFSL